MHLLVLLGFLVLLAPKELLHDCELHPVRKEIGEKNTTNLKQGVEKCAICDWHLPVLFPSKSQVKIVSFEEQDIPYRFYFSASLLKASSNHQSRGPPRRCFN